MIDTKRRSREVQYPRFRGIPIRPINGVWKFSPGSDEFPEGASPDMLNCYVYEGRLRKRPGYAMFPLAMPSIGGSAVGIYSTQDEENNTHLIVVWQSGVKKYDFVAQVWNTLTGTLSGGSDQWFTFETSQNNIVFSQGVDKIKKHDISTVNTVFADLSASAPIARYITRFADRLYAAYTVEGGVTKPFRIRRPVAGDHTNWAGAGSGFNDLTEWPYQLRGIRKLGEGMSVFTERSISLATRTGNALAPAAFSTKTEGVGLYAERTLCALPGSSGHIFMGNDDIYLWNGVQEKGIALPFRDYIFNSVTPSSIRANFAIVMSDTQQYLLFAAINAATVPNMIWVYHYGRNIFYPWSVEGPTCSTLVRNDDTTTIDDLIGTIDQQNWEYDSRILASAYPSLLTGHSDGKVYKWGEQHNSDAGVPIRCLWTSRDFESDDIASDIAPHRITLRSLEVKYYDAGADFTIDLYYSTNGGGSWEGPYPLLCPTNLVSGGQACSVDSHQVTGERVRFKFEQTSLTESFQIIEFNVNLELREPIQT